ncbi:MAG: glycosyltransferase [Chthoniobacter sp.]|uniref:glycosyltransferase n=1 Tax=Chthoniobacter sp. TaxID=2510640 RepID=UPI0032A806B2
MIPGTALIATVYQEGAGIRRWLEALAAQTDAPEEFIIVDAASSDDTVSQITSFPWPGDFPKPHVIVERCNIATGRNIAIQKTEQPVIISTDAGSFPAPDWLTEITRPLMENPDLEVTGGLSLLSADSEFQRFLAKFEAREQSGVSPSQFNPSSRNTAFRRQAWADVGGYPEWLTLAGEDALFTLQLNKIGKKMDYNPKAIVHWEIRKDASAYYKLLYRNGYGAAEAGFAKTHFLRQALIVIFPPLLLLSRHRFRHLKFRYLKNYFNARGWMEGYLSGHRPPPGWHRLDGILLSPEAQRFLPPTGL